VDSGESIYADNFQVPVISKLIPARNWAIGSAPPFLALRVMRQFGYQQLINICCALTVLQARDDSAEAKAFDAITHDSFGCRKVVG
jgi:hypothetical protein